LRVRRHASLLVVYFLSRSPFRPVSRAAAHCQSLLPAGWIAILVSGLPARTVLSHQAYPIRMHYPDASTAKQAVRAGHAQEPFSGRSLGTPDRWW